MTKASVIVVGGGPAGLMAAEVLIEGGVNVDLYDAMPSVGRKFLLAGKGGMNITHAEAYPTFLSRYGARQVQLEPLLDAFGPQTLRDWVHCLGLKTFVGSSGRVFPSDMKAAPLLRAWLHRLRQQGVQFHMRERWCGWSESGKPRFAGEDGEHLQCADATVLALGGGSWRKLGSDGAWVSLLAQRGVVVTPLKPSNCGFDVEGGWSEHFLAHFSGQPVKTVAINFTGTSGESSRTRGDFVVTRSGIEGTLVYALSASLRDEIEARGIATLNLDLAPDWEAERLIAEVSRPRGSRSLASHLQSRVGIKGVKTGLLRELLPAQDFYFPQRLAAAIKSLPLRLAATRPLNEAISTAGGVSFSALDEKLMLRQLPGIFCAGEMLDWEAPTGGYLLTACFASGHAAGHGALEWLRTQS